MDLPSWVVQSGERDPGGAIQEGSPVVVPRDWSRLTCLACVGVTFRAECALLIVYYVVSNPDMLGV